MTNPATEAKGDHVPDAGKKVTLDDAAQVTCHIPEEDHSLWIGDKQNGIEFRPLEIKDDGSLDVLDEVLVWINGECIVHVEAMSDQHYWMGVYLDGVGESHVNFASRNGRSFVDCTGELIADRPNPLLRKAVR